MSRNGSCVLPLAAAALVAVLAVAGCAPRHPLGIGDDDWQAMSVEARAAAHRQQAELDRAGAEARAAEARARAAEAAARSAELEALRGAARYGDRVQCVLSAAEARLGGSWRAVEPVALDLVRGMDVDFTLAEPMGSTLRRSARAFAGFDGQTVWLCRGEAASARTPDLGACARMLGTFEDYRAGHGGGVNAPDFLRAHLRCDLAPGEGMPQRVIINRR